jgi:hypothetical protein
MRRVLVEYRFVISLALAAMRDCVCGPFRPITRSWN